MSKALELADGQSEAQMIAGWLESGGGHGVPSMHALRAARELRRLDRVNAELREALQAQQEAQAMPIYGNYEGFVWPKVEMRKEGEPSWGWICEKHGLGYQGGCICCSDDWKRHQDTKDREARYARDDALHAASNKARAALSSSGGTES